MTEAEVEELVQTELARVRSSYVDDGRTDQLPSAMMLSRIGKDGKRLEPGEGYAVTFVVIAGEASTDYAQALRDQAWANDAVFIALALEVWFVEIPKDASAVLKAEIAAAQASGRLHGLDKSLLQERARVHVESEWTPHRWFDAKITRESDRVSLSPWTELKIQAPRPGFRRYLPERIDGKRVLKVGLPSGVRQ